MHCEEKLHNFILFLESINILQIESAQHILSIKAHSEGFDSLMLVSSS